MSSFIKNSNLPEGKVTSLICGTDDKLILDFFEMNDIEALKNEANPLVDPSVSTHCDMAAVYLGEGKVLIDSNQHKLNESLGVIGCNITKADTAVTGEYPDDIKLNFAIAGEHIIGNFPFADSKLIELTKNFKKIQVKQGYSKCSTLIVSKKALITDDNSIYRKASENGFDCLLISKGDVYLEGHEYGFIGGASGKIANDTVVFFGDIKKHRDFEKINSFLIKHNCKYICTDDLQLRDIGGIIPVKEII